MRCYAVTDDTLVLADSTEVPGLGHLPVNAFLLRAVEPLLVDTGLAASRGEFLHHLWSACDPADLRWDLAHPANTGWSGASATDQAALEAMLAGFAPAPT